MGEKIFESDGLQLYLHNEPYGKYFKKYLTFRIGEVEVTISGDDVWRFADTLDNYGIHP